MTQAHLDTPKANILLVDDTPANLKLLSGMLVEQGYKVRSVINGTMALKAAQAAPPDLILLDINMPNMNGYEVCKRLKSDDATQHIPVIFISALDEVLDKVQAFSAGGVDYISKPFQFEEVLVRLETHLTLHHLQKQLEHLNTDLEQRVEARTAELVNLNAAYQRFVPPELLTVLGKESILQVGLGDQVEKEMSILFSDIRGFTALSEKMTPQENFNYLNAYLGRVSPIIRQHRGFIDKYIGDAIMALFGTQAEDALLAAIALHREVALYNQHRQKEGHQPVRIGTSVHTGPVMLGMLGEAERLQGTVISDAVNLGSRLEGVTKMYNIAIVISEQVLKQIKDPSQYHLRFTDKIQVKGHQAPISVFEVFDTDTPEMIELKLKTKTTFEEGLSLYYNKRFTEASVRFSDVLKHNPNDKAAKLYLERSAHYMVEGTPPNWTGVERLMEK